MLYKFKAHTYSNLPVLLTMFEFQLVPYCYNGPSF